MKQRVHVKELQDIPNVGPAIERDLILIGVMDPVSLIGRDPYAMYDELCTATGGHHDPCVIDVFISAVRYMEGAPAKKWWEYTCERKKVMEGKR
jgi:hypothetical protein